MEDSDVLANTRCARASHPQMRHNVSADGPLSVLSEVCHCVPAAGGSGHQQSLDTDVQLHDPWRDKPQGH